MFFITALSYWLVRYRIVETVCIGDDFLKLESEKTLTYEPLNSLKKVDENIWIVDSEVIQTKASYQHLLFLAAEKIIIAHGRWFEKNATKELKRAFRWLDK